jgi:hypothetical protein
MDSAIATAAETSTALVPQLPQALVIAQRQRDEAKEKYQNDRLSKPALFGGLGGVLGGFVTVFVAVHPVTTIIGGLVVLSGLVSAHIGKFHEQKLQVLRDAAEERVAVMERAIAREQTKAEMEIQAQSIERLKAATEDAFNRALARFEMRMGMEFPLATDDKELKILRIEQVEARELLKDDAFVPITTVTAQLYNAHTGADGNLERDQPVPRVPAVKRTIVQSEKALPR